MNKLQALKCIEVTSQAQADNGTVCYHDPISNCDYLSYENGYIRRAYTKTHKTSYGMVYTNRSIYQLNPTKLHPYTSSFDGNTYYTKTRTMVMDPEQRMEILSKSVVNYRQYLKKQKPVLTYNN